MPKTTKTTKPTRSVVVPVRFTPEERDYLKELSGGMSLSKVIRLGALNKPIPQRRRKQRIPPINLSTYIELGKIGNNINQIARAQNTALASGLHPPDIAQSIFDELRELINQLRLELIIPPLTDDDVFELEAEAHEELEGAEDDWEDS